MSTFLHIIVPCMFVLLALLVASTVFVVTSLRTKFPVLWDALGRPVGWIYMARTSIANHFFKFLDSQQYLETNDLNFIRQCRLLKAGWYVFFSLFIAAFVTGFGYFVFKNAL